MFRVFRIVLIGAAGVVIVMGAFIASQRSSQLALTDCEIASRWYTFRAIGNEDFETFLLERYRINGIVDSGNLFTPPRYGVAILEQDHQEAEIVDFIVHRNGSFSSEMTMSISVEEWNRHERIVCANALEETLRSLLQTRRYPLSYLKSA